MLSIAAFTTSLALSPTIYMRVCIEHFPVNVVFDFLVVFYESNKIFLKVEYQSSEHLQILLIGKDVVIIISKYQMILSACFLTSTDGFL